MGDELEAKRRRLDSLNGQPWGLSDDDAVPLDDQRLPERDFSPTCLDSHAAVDKNENPNSRQLCKDCSQSDQVLQL